MYEFIGTKYKTSDLLKDTAQAWVTRNHWDGFKILQYLQERDPYTVEENLINLPRGEVADESFNVHQVFEIGEKLIRGRSNQLALSFSFKRKEKLVLMKRISLLPINGEKIHVDSALLC